MLIFPSMKIIIDNLCSFVHVGDQTLIGKFYTSSQWVMQNNVTQQLSDMRT